MPSSNTTRKKPSDRQQKTSKKQYGSGWGQPVVDLELPSGEVCQVKRVGVQGLIKIGALASLDTLTSIVQTETIPKAAGKPPMNVDAVVSDPKKLDLMMATVDKIVAATVLQPKVVNHQIEDLDEEGKPKLNQEGDPVLRELTDEERDEFVAKGAEKGRTVVFTDWIDMIDRMFIMNFIVGGQADLATFRQATEAALGSVPAGEAAASATE